MFALFILVVAITTYCAAFAISDAIRYIGMMIAFNRVDSGIRKVDGINAFAYYIIAGCVPFIVWYCWTH